MENNLQIFNSVEFGKIRTIIKDDNVWFIGKDVAEALGYSNTSKAIITHIDKEDKQFLMLDIVNSKMGMCLLEKLKPQLLMKVVYIV